MGSAVGARIWVQDITLRGRWSRRRVLVRPAAATGGPVLFALLGAATGPDAGAARGTGRWRSDPARRRRPRGAPAPRPRLCRSISLCVRSGDSGGRRGDHGLVGRTEPADGYWPVPHGDRHLRRAGIRHCAAVQGARASRALGATNHSLRRLVAAHTLRLLVTGATAGVAATFALTRMVRSAGGEGSSFDTPEWQAFALPVLVVFAVGALATWIPARRAMRIDPAILLKAE